MAMNFNKPNLDILKSKHPALFEKIQRENQGELVHVQEVPGKFPSLKAVLGEGREILLSSRHRPQEEAQTMLSSLDLSSVSSVIVIGFGLGYHVEEILNKYPNLLVLVVDPYISIFKKALDIRDCSKILNNPNVRIIVESDPILLLKELRARTGDIFYGQIQLFSHEATRALDSKKVDEIRQHIREVTNWHLNNWGINMSRSSEFQKNIVANLPEILQAQGVKNLFGIFKNKPVLCVAAGPSLNASLPLLKEAQGKAVIVCVDTVMRVLLKEGITPDFVVSIDYTELNYAKYDGLMEQTQNLSLVFDPEVFPRIVQEYQGRKFVMNVDKSIVNWLDQYIDEKGYLPKGTTTAHSAFSLAHALGGNPIILIGQDLCMKGSSHADGVVMKMKAMVGVDQKTKKPILVRQKSDGNYVGEPAIMVPDNSGGEAPTTSSMFSFITLFGEFIASSGVTCINTSENGAVIKGTQVMKLADALAKYCKSPFPIQERIDDAHVHLDPEAIQGVLNQLDGLIREFTEIGNLGKEGHRAIQKLLNEKKKKTISKHTEKKLIDRSNQSKDRLLSFSEKTRHILNDHMSSYTFLVNKIDKERGLTPSEMELKQIRKAGVFFEGVEKSAQALIHLFFEGRNKLERTLLEHV